MDGMAPVVVAANWYRFRAGERVRHERVMSACLIWSLEGAGTITSAGVRFRVTPRTLLRLPWAHDVEYVADDRAPFRLGTVHVVPHHRRDVPVVPGVAHVPGDPMLAAPERSGDGADTGARLLPAGSAASARTIALGAYAVERMLMTERTTGAEAFDETAFDETVFRALGELLAAEERAWGEDAPTTSGIPAAVESMTAYAERHLTEPLSVRQLADVGGCSPATAERLFAKHTGSSVSVWIRGARMREAASLLRGSGLRVGEVARAVGFTDPLYFSRVFRAAFGVPPSRYAAARMRP